MGAKPTDNAALLCAPRRPLTTTLPLRHFLLALAVVLVWGSNFVVMKRGLDTLPPVLFAFLRFAFAFLPAAFFIARPKVSWGRLASYGVLIGVGQFGLLYIALTGHISAGLTSLVVQMQVFFTIGLVMWLEGERLRAYQWAALVLALAGLAVIGAHVDAQTSVTGLALVLAAGLAWGCGNVVARGAGRVDALGLVVWSSAFALPPLALMSLLFDGPAAITKGLHDADMVVWGAVLWQSLGNTLFGYAVWGWLFSRYPASTIAPLALLIPVVGIGSAALWLDEPLPTWKLGAAALVLAGLALNLFGPRLSGYAAKARRAA